MSKPSEPYRPGSVVEAMRFMRAYCESGCGHADDGGICTLDITARMEMFEIGEPDYPPQIVWGRNERPTCTAYQLTDDSPPRLRDLPGQLRFPMETMP
jgi:hypothetical protein